MHEQAHWLCCVCVGALVNDAPVSEYGVLLMGVIWWNATGYHYVERLCFIESSLCGKDHCLSHVCAPDMHLRYFEVVNSCWECTWVAGAVCGGGCLPMCMDAPLVPKSCRFMELSCEA